MGHKDDDVQKVRIVEGGKDKWGGCLLRLVGILLAAAALLAWVDSCQHRQPAWRPDPGPSPFLQSLASIASGAVALLALAVLAYLARRYGPRLLAALRHDLSEARAWL